MRIGVPREIKPQENRVALTPAGAHALCGAGHEVLIERSAGAGCGFADDAYAAEGAQLAADAGEVFDRAELILKVKEPIAAEFPLLKADKILFTYLHLAQSALGARFELRQFHDLITTGGSMAMPRLQKRVDGWIEGQL